MGKVSGRRDELRSVVGISPFPSASLHVRHFRQAAARELGTYFATHTTLLLVARETSADLTVLTQVLLLDVTGFVKMLAFSFRHGFIFL